MKVKLWKCCALMLVASSYFSTTWQASAIQLIDLDNYFDPIANEYDTDFIPKHLTHPLDAIMATGRTASDPETLGGSGVVVAPNWVLRATHAPGQVGQTLVIDGSDYTIAQREDLGADLTLIRITTPGGANANLTNYSIIDPDLLVSSATTYTLGGYGRVRKLLSNGDFDPSQTYVTARTLHWGKARFDILPDSVGSNEHYPFEANTASGDSGGGTFLRDGWDWKQVGAARSLGLLNISNYNAIKNTITNNGANNAAFPSLGFTIGTKPTINITYSGGANGSWSTSGNWSTSAVPTFNASSADNVAVTGSNAVVIGSSVSAEAQDLLIGRLTSSTSESQAARVSLQSGGELNAGSVFIGADTGEFGVLNISGGDLIAEGFFVGLNGRGAVNHTAGTSNTGRLVVGKNNNGSVTMNQYNLGGSNTPTVNTDVLIIGDNVGSTGYFAQNDLSELNTNKTVVGHKGTGTFDHSYGSHSTDELVLGDIAGADGTYALLNDGELKTDVSIVGKAGTGHFYQDNNSIHETNELIIDNGSEYFMEDGTLIARKVVGEINFDYDPQTNGQGTIEVEGLTDFSGATFANPLLGKIQQNFESLLLISSSLPTFGTDVDNSDLDPHVVGTALEITDGGFRGFGTLTDEITVGENGYIKVQAIDSTNSDGLILTSDLNLEDNASILVEQDAVLHLHGGLTTTSGQTVIQNNGTIWLHDSDAEISANATLTIAGTLIVATGASTFDVNGTLDLGPGIKSLIMSRDNAPPAGSLAASFGDSSVLQIEISDDGSDYISSNNNITYSLDGTLDLTRIDDFVPNIGDVHDIIAADGTVSGIFDEVSGVIIDFGTPAGDDLGLAVFYESNAVRVRTTLMGDVNMDNIVNTADLVILNNNILMTGASWADGDLNGDGVVGGIDSALLMENWFREYDPPSLLSVPEPPSLLLAAFALSQLVMRMPRRTRISS
jgi:hypothetical protein